MLLSRVKERKSMGQMNNLYRDYIDHMQLFSRNDVSESDAWYMLNTNIKSVVSKDTFHKDYVTYVKGKDENDK